MAREEDDNQRTPEELLGATVAELRKLRGWSQTELGRRMAGFGYTWPQYMVARLEAGTRPIRFDEAVALASVLEFSLDDALAGRVVQTQADARRVRAQTERVQREAAKERERLQREARAARERLQDLARELEATEELMREAEE